MPSILFNQIPIPFDWDSIGLDLDLDSISLDLDLDSLTLDLDLDSLTHILTEPIQISLRARKGVAMPIVLRTNHSKNLLTLKAGFS